MLPNYGAGQIRLYHQDLTMMMSYNTRERTTTEMINIGFVFCREKHFYLLLIAEKFELQKRGRPTCA